jgi:hypothetical protein
VAASRSRSRRGRRTVPASSDSPSPSGDYWKEFLKAKGFRGMIPTEQLVVPLSEEERRVDQGFLNFLRIASEYGAPKNMEEFMRLPLEERQYYLRAYEIFLREQRKRKRQEQGVSKRFPPA